MNVKNIIRLMESESLFPTILPNAIDSSRDSQNAKTKDAQNSQNSNQNCVILPKEKDNPNNIIQVHNNPDKSTGVHEPLFPLQNNQIMSKQSNPALGTFFRRPLTTKNTIKQRPYSSRQLRPPHVSPQTSEFIYNPTIIPNDIKILETIEKELTNLCQYHSKCQHYEEVQNLQRLIRSTQQKLAHYSNHQPMDEINKLLMKRNEIQRIIKKIEENWSSNFQDFIKVSQQQLDQLQANHNKEIEFFDRATPVDLTPQYRKKSISLMEMREKERALAMAKNYLKAQEMKLSADSQEKYEVQKQYHKMVEDRKRKRDLLIKSQEEQLQVFLEHFDLEKTDLLKQRRKNVEGYIKRLNFVEKELERRGVNEESIQNFEMQCNEKQLDEVANTELQNVLFKNNSTFTKISKTHQIK